MKDSAFPLSRPACIFLWAHDSSLTRRLAWRFESRGLRVENRRIDVTRPDFSEPLRDEDTAHVVDLGWTDTQIHAAMSVVFSLTDPDRSSFEPMPICVLAPWFDSSTRPAWAELGVKLVLDRTSPPPEIANRVMHWSTGE